MNDFTVLKRFASHYLAIVITGLSFIVFLPQQKIYAHSIQNSLHNEGAAGSDVRMHFLYERNDTACFSDAGGKLISRAIDDLAVSEKVQVQTKVDAIKDLNTTHVIRTEFRIEEYAPPLAFIGVVILIIIIVSKVHVRIQSKAIIAICVALGWTLYSFTDPTIVAHAFLPFYPEVHTHYDSNYFYVESRGIPQTHEMMVGISDHGWQQQVPIPQCYIGNNAWSIPLNPVISQNPIPVDQVHFTRGAVAIAVNGVPIFNPHTNTGVDAYLDGQLDLYGGHCGRGDDYHYHTAPLHLYEYTTNNLPIAYAFDGFAVYGGFEPDGQPMQPLDANHGHYFNGEYHYHGTESAPYMIARFAGVVNEDSTHQLVPQAQAQPIRNENWGPLNGAMIEQCVMNSNGDGYNLSYSLNGVNGYATNYYWNGNQYYFEYVTPQNSNSIVYNGFFQCEVPLSMMEESTDIHPDFFPNPFRETLHAKVTKASTRYDLYNSSGTWIMRSSTPQEFASPTIPPGLYFITTTESPIIRRLVKY